MYEWDDQYIGKDWSGPGTFIRNGSFTTENTP